eukprot:TRINITY_DN2588_c0_g4_i1.p1 TRINITY_DN2588_c0_g4~~TRINITY_DN2588_c0_g4_i1.p1  ORF type:complete len:827 (-),score=219.42 TRINITY_DN2588_c0_g4_i1:273-2711(-)
MADDKQHTAPAPQPQPTATSSLFGIAQNLYNQAVQTRIAQSGIQYLQSYETVRELLAKAQSHYEEALKANPNDASLLQAYAKALYEEAQLYGAAGNQIVQGYTTKARTEALQRSQAAYAKVLQYSPYDVTALGNYAWTVIEQAKSRVGFQQPSGANKDATATTNTTLFGQLKAAYEAALKLRPNDFPVLNSYATSILNYARATRIAQYGAVKFQQYGGNEYLALAKEKYEAALKLQPNDIWALANYGSTLFEQAKNASGNQARELLAQAQASYDKALSLAPKNYELITQYANVITDYFRATTVGRISYDYSKKLYTVARNQYEEAIKLKAEDADTYAAYGSALFTYAKLKIGAESQELIKLGQAKYEEALKLRPNDYQVIKNYADALMGYITHVSSVSKARINGVITVASVNTKSLLQLAQSKYEAALKLQPKDALLLTNYANTYLAQAQLVSYNKSTELVAKARSTFESAIHQRQHEYEVLLSTANSFYTYLKSNSSLATENVSELLGYVRSKYEQVLALKPEDLNTLVRYATVILDQARNKIGAEANEFYLTAQTKFEELAKAYPAQHQQFVILTQYGKGLLNYAKQINLADPERAKQMLELARSKYEAALAFQPTDKGALTTYSLILLEQAKHLGAEGDKLRQNVGTRLQSMYEFFLAQAKEKSKEEAAGAAGTTTGETVTETGASKNYLKGLLNVSSAILEQGRSKLKENKYVNNWLEESNKLYDQVKVVLKDVEAVVKENYNYYGYSSYQIAVLYAQLGKEEQCKEWLLTAKTNNLLPSRELIEKDILLAEYHSKPWFQEFIASLDA